MPKTVPPTITAAMIYNVKSDCHCSADGARAGTRQGNPVGRKKVSITRKEPLRTFKSEELMPGRWGHDGGWTVARRGCESCAEEGCFVDRDCNRHRGCRYGSGDGLGRLAVIAGAIQNGRRAVHGRHAGLRLR